jgi:hypothetical protein
MSSELTNIQVFSGDVKVTDGLRVDTSTLSVTSDTNRVGINQASPSASLDVSGNLHTTSNLTVGTTLFHVDSTNKRVGIGKTILARDFEAFANENNKFAVIGRAIMGRSTTYPAFGHIDQLGSDGDHYAFMQDNTNGDTYLNGGANSILFFTKNNGGVACYRNGKFRIGSVSEASHKFQTSSNSKLMRWNIPYIYLQSPSTSYSSNNFHNINSGYQKLRFYEARLNNILTYSRDGSESVTIPTGYAGFYRIHVHCNVASFNSSAQTRAMRLEVYNRTTRIASIENNVNHRYSTTYSAFFVTTYAQLDEGDVINAGTAASGDDDDVFSIHYPNTLMTMFMVNGHSI